MNFKLGELFCGAGGIGLGAKQAIINDSKNETFKITHVWATDNEESACETYQYNICPKSSNSVICADIRKLNYDLLAQISDVDSLAFGFPCNDFSIVGQQKGLDGEFAPLYKYCVKAVKKIEPKFFIAENVGGMRSLI